jgi:cyclic pyranopterin phosphate synthase
MADGGSVKKLTHLNPDGGAHMVDVGAKKITRRVAVASARICIGKELSALIASKSVPKGDVFGVARIAGIMAAKKTAELIPLCHSLALDAVEVTLTLQIRRVVIVATVSTSARTGVEMEALTAVSVAALAFYDMCKSIDRTMVIERVQLDEKHGGKSGTFMRKERTRDR